MAEMKLRARAPRCQALFLALGLLASTTAAAKDPLASLSERYHKWASEEVAWILTTAERDELVALKSDEERDRFIDRFWRLRDPEPLTPENEFKDEHYRRLTYVNKYFSSDTARKGWQTDRGKVWILLGKPDDVERVVTANETYPYEMWFYGNTARMGLPGQIRLLFYRPFGNGEYRLLNPAIESSRLFPPTSQIDQNNPRILQELLGPEVSQAIVTVSPGSGAAGSDEVIQELTHPRSIPERIRERGLALNPEVQTNLSLAAVELHLKKMVMPLGDGEGTLRLHFGAELPPEEISFREVSGERYFARIDIFGDITDAKGVVVARIDDTANLKLTKKEVEERRRHAFSFETTRDLIPGRYRVKLILQDFTRGRLARADEEVVLSPPPPPPAIQPLALAFRVDRAPAATAVPFQLGDVKLHVHPQPVFHQGDTIYAAGWLRELTAASGADLAVKVEVRRGDETAFAATARSPEGSTTGGTRQLVVAVPTAALTPGRYELRMTAASAEGVVASATTPLELTDKAVPPGFFVYNEIRALPPEVSAYNRGIQLLSKGDIPGAQRHFRVALDHRPGFHPASVQLARALLLGGSADQAETLLDRVLAVDPGDYDALVTRASMLLARGDFAGARTALEKALESGPRSKEVLNALGEAAIGLKDAEGAKRWLKESLEKDPKQAPVRQRLLALGGA